VAAAKATGADILTPGNDYFHGMKVSSRLKRKRPY
jgi:hypothetical protein